MANKRKIIMITVIILTIVLLLNFVGCTENDEISDEAVEGSKGQEDKSFSLEYLDSVDALLEDQEGNVVYVNFWGMDCPYCLIELPDVDKLNDRYAGDDDVRILTINFTDSSSDVKELMEDEGYGFDVVMDKDEKAARHFEVMALPSIYVLDGEGEIVFANIGAVSYDEAESEIESAR